MLYEVLYLIRPKTVLIEVLNEYPDFGLLFVRPVTWLHERGGYNSLRDQEYITGIKKLFLAQFRSDVLLLQSPACEPFLERLMAQPPFSVDLFEKWWDIEQIDLVSRFEDAVARIKFEQIELLMDTDMPRADHWVSNIGNMIKDGRI